MIKKNYLNHSNQFLQPQERRSGRQEINGAICRQVFTTQTHSRTIYCSIQKGKFLRSQEVIRLTSKNIFLISMKGCAGLKRGKQINMTWQQNNLIMILFSPWICP